jgi:hypothetical protein
MNGDPNAVLRSIRRRENRHAISISDVWKTPANAATLNGFGLSRSANLSTLVGSNSMYELDLHPRVG